MTDIEETALSFLPSLDDDKKSLFLSYMVMNFSVREAIKLSGIHEKTFRRWKEGDPNFLHLVTDGLTDIRQRFASQYIDMQFTRNFHMVMQKDFKVLYKDAVAPTTLSDDEKGYLLRIRSHYTPQSLAMIKQILGGGTTDQPFDFTKLTLTIRREREQIEIKSEG